MLEQVRNSRFASFVGLSQVVSFNPNTKGNTFILQVAKSIHSHKLTVCGQTIDTSSPKQAGEQL